MKSLIKYLIYLLFRCFNVKEWRKINNYIIISCINLLLFEVCHIIIYSANTEIQRNLFYAKKYVLYLVIVNFNRICYSNSPKKCPRSIKETVAFVCVICKIFVAIRDIFHRVPIFTFTRFRDRKAYRSDPCRVLPSSCIPRFKAYADG